jgi:hypothetical protein
MGLWNRTLYTADNRWIWVLVHAAADGENDNPGLDGVAQLHRESLWVGTAWQAPMVWKDDDGRLWLRHLLKKVAQARIVNIRAE